MITVLNLEVIRKTLKMTFFVLFLRLNIYTQEM